MNRRPTGAGQAVALLLAVLEAADEPEDRQHNEDDDQNANDELHGRQGSR